MKIVVRKANPRRVSRTYKILHKTLLVITSPISAPLALLHLVFNGLAEGIEWVYMFIRKLCVYNVLDWYARDDEWYGEDDEGDEESCGV